MSKSKFMLAFLVIIILLFTQYNLPSSAQNVKTDILLLYSLPQERAEIENIISNLPTIDTELTSTVFDNFDGDLTSIDVLIMVSSIEFSFTDSQEDALVDFANSKMKSIITFSPFIQELKAELESILGLNHVDSIYPRDTDTTEWNITLNTQIGNLASGTETSYVGKYTLVEPVPNAKIIASITGSVSTEEEISEFEFPLPAIINNSDSNTQIITGSLSPISDGSLGNVTTQALHVNSLVDIFDGLIMELISYSITKSNKILTTISDPIFETSLDDNNELIDFISSLAFFLNLNQLVFIGIVTLILLLSRKILAFFRWLSEKVYLGLIIVISGLYNVNDHVLDDNQVLLNKSRSSIMEFLEHVAHYGSHLREIKSVTKMGMGVLLWHLRILEDFGWVEKYKINRYTVFVASEYALDFDAQFKRVEYKLISKYTKTILYGLIKAERGVRLNFFTLAENTSVDQKTLKRILTVLDTENLIEFSQNKPRLITIKNHNQIVELTKSIQLRQEFKLQWSSLL